MAFAGPAGAGHHQQGEGMGGGPPRAAGAATLLRPGSLVEKERGVEHARLAGLCGGAGGGVGSAGGALSFKGDVLLLVYLLAVARFCTAWAALETGSAFEGMGAAREVSY